ncbi:MAG: threonine--tRNA ligase [Vampirovibrionales bacterium]|nr:threonine--tRNA ligase [Vampirovibrionales bacterium]
MTVTLPNGASQSLTRGASALDLARAIGPGLAKAAVACEIVRDGGEPFLSDFHAPLQDGDRVRLLTSKDPESLWVLRHTAAHVMAQAVQRLFPSAKIAIGPAIETGFYYDFEIPDHTLTPDDFAAIEAEIARIVAQGQRLRRREVSPAEVDATLAQLRAQGEIYKAELLESHRDHGPTFYDCVSPEDGAAKWFDFCAGPHLQDTSGIKAVKLLSVAGAYWRGDEKNAQLQRIYATAFWSQADLDAFLQQREEAERRDHRKLARELDLFSIRDEIGPGLILWHPPLATVREELEAFLRQKLREYDYQTVYTPHLAKKDLWDISGHTSHYLENMFTLDIEGQPYILKPMNCPMHTMIFKSHLHSYRDLPIRIAEMGTVYRYEKSGVMHGLNRVRGFTQDDAHLFCRPDQIQSEILDLIAFINETFAAFGMAFSQVELSTRPEQYVGELADWNEAEAALKNALDASGSPFVVNEGDGAFYGPKIDFKIQDAIGRTWQCATIQLDFNLPARFELSYKDSDGAVKRPIMIHRAIFGSMERFVGILIEHYAGAFPLWLAPTQAMILPISDRHLEAARQTQKTLRAAGLRALVDESGETIGNKIRKAQLQKIPYMLVLGDKEIEQDAVAVRERRAGNLGAMPLARVCEVLRQEATSRAQATTF